MAAPAQAGSLTSAPLASACSHQNENTIDLPGRPDVWIGITLCITRNSGTNHAFADIRWDSSFTGIGNRFDKFDLQVRLEKYDAVIASGTCSLKKALNDNASGSAKCGGVTKTDSRKNGWSADGKATYNVNNDGAGDKTWQLDGSSPLLP